MDRIANIFALIIVLAIISTILASKNTKSDIAALGTAFSGSIKAATGR